MKESKDNPKSRQEAATAENTLLSTAEIDELLKPLGDWHLVPDAKSIRAEFKARNFLSATFFIQKVALLADKIDHHPDVHLTDYRNLSFEVTNHKAKGLTRKDFLLAGQISQAFSEYTGPLEELQKQRDIILDYKPHGR